MLVSVALTSLKWMSMKARNTFGALAQLGEHLLCKQRVIGSIPIGSTIILDALISL